MKNFLRLFFDGFGNVNYGSGGAAAAAVASASDGLSLTGTDARLGQPVAAVGDPAKLLQAREIPLNGFPLSFRNPAGDGIIQIQPDGSIAQANKNGDAWQTQWVIGADSSSYNLHTNGGTGAGTGDVEETFNGVDSMRYDPVTVPGSPQFKWTAPVIGAGLGGSIRKTINVNDSFFPLDTTLLIDDSLGLAHITIDPTKIPGQFGWVKKLGSTVNAVILSVAAGHLIFGGGTSALTFTFTDPGESIQFQSDGTNLYIL